MQRPGNSAALEPGRSSISEQHVCNVSLSIIFALIVGVCILGGLQTTASAQTTVPPSADVVNEEKVYRFKKLLEETTGDDIAKEAKRQRYRGILSNAARGKLPGLSRALVARGGLAGVASGIWIHNGVMLWNASLCGQADCPEPLILDTQFKKATAAEQAVYIEYSNGSPIASLMLLSYAWVPTSATGGTATYSFALQGNPRCGGGNCAYTRFVTSLASSTSASVVEYRSTMPLEQSLSGSFSSSGSNLTGQPHMMTHFSPSDTYTVRPVGPVFDPKGSYNWENPVFEIGEVGEVVTPPAVTHEYGRDASNDFVNDVAQRGCPSGTVAAPEAPPAPEVCPDYFPEEWEEEFEEETNPAPGESPYDDPDEDGIPNHQDDDDDGDGVPDEEDPSPYVPLPESPGGDPDEDGTPNRDDPDDDNDGIPDEDDPEPFSPTDPATLPQDHPYADPDEDGDPNRTDPDQDGDGIPNEDDPDPYAPTDPTTLPEDHPYADPDEDGEPNRTDPDQDGDGVPNEDDPAPFDPTVPGTEPDPDPGNDRDADDVPDTIDPAPDDPLTPARWSEPDTDEDWMPDERDPAPNDPAVPTSEPTPDSDEDQDGTPNIHDPSPTDPTIPGEPTSDPDQDGTETKRDPDPYRQTYPEGEPSADPDNDGIPTSGDQYPETPNLPGEPPTNDTGESCPVARSATFEIPEVQYEDVFPFSLILYCWDALGDLVGQSDPPSFELSLLGTVSVPASAEVAVGIVRNCIAFVFAVGACLWFYRYISGKGSDA